MSADHAGWIIQELLVVWVNILWQRTPDKSGEICAGPQEIDRKIIIYNDLQIIFRDLASVKV